MTACVLLKTQLKIWVSLLDVGKQPFIVSLLDIGNQQTY